MGIHVPCGSELASALEVLGGGGVRAFGHVSVRANPGGEAAHALTSAAVRG